MKKINRFATTALAVGGLLAGALVARAQDVTSPADTAPGTSDLILAFNVSGNTNTTVAGGTDIGGTQDLEVDLGSLASLGSSASFNISADLNAIYGNPATNGTTGWNSSIRPDTLTWTVFGANENTNEFWTLANGTSPKEESQSTQGTPINNMETIYGDLAATGTTTNGSAVAANSGNVNEANDSGSFGQVIVANNDWGYGSHWGNGNLLVDADDNSAIAFYDVVPAGDGGTTNAHAPEVGTFTLESDGVLDYTSEAIPEPSTWATMIFGAASLLAFRRRRA